MNELFTFPVAIKKVLAANHLGPERWFPSAPRRTCWCGVQLPRCSTRPTSI